MSGAEDGIKFISLGVEKLRRKVEELRSLRVKRNVLEVELAEVVV